MNKLLIATNNRHKVEEIKHLIAPLTFDILSLRDVHNAPVTDEDQPTLEGNALKKAREAFHATGMLTLADDTGLECYYLALDPGVFSARYAGEGATRRGARFRTVVAIVGKNFEKVFEGKVEGKILENPRGSNGFGYDPLFVPDGYSKTYAELSIEEKNKLSHRAEAMKKAVEFLKTV